MSLQRADAGGTCFAFQAPLAYAEQLRRAGFGVVNQANNHSMDYGESGRAQTLTALRGAGVRQTGLPGEITTVQVKKAKVAFVGFAPYSFDADLLDIPAAQALIRRARRRAHVVVVLIHAGAEGADRDHTPMGPSTSWARTGAIRGRSRTPPSMPAPRWFSARDRT